MLRGEQLEHISDSDLDLIRGMVRAQRAIPAIVVAAVIARLDRAEDRLKETLGPDAAANGKVLLQGAD